MRLTRLLGRNSAALMGLASLTLGACAHIPVFEAELGKQEMAGHTMRPPYATTLSYYGYIAPGAEPDEVKEGKKMTYVYLWLPVATPELGVRAVSPAKTAPSFQKKSDYADAAYLENKRSSLYFDPWIRVERCLAALNPEDVAKPCGQWLSFGENDDSNELPANPAGNKVNSLLRIDTHPDEPLRALTRGLYRIAVSSNKVGEIEGSFFLQVGIPGVVSGGAMARSPADLARTLSGQPQDAKLSVEDNGTTGSNWGKNGARKWGENGHGEADAIKASSKDQPTSDMKNKSSESNSSEAQIERQAGRTYGDVK